MKCTMQAPGDALHAFWAGIRRVRNLTCISVHSWQSAQPPSPTNRRCVLQSSLIRPSRSGSPCRALFVDGAVETPPLSSRSLTGSNRGRAGAWPACRACETKLRTVTPAGLGQVAVGAWSVAWSCLVCRPACRMGMDECWMLGAWVTPMQSALCGDMHASSWAIKPSPSLALSWPVRARPHRFLLSSSSPYLSWLCPLP